MRKMVDKEFYDDLKNKGLRYCPNCETVKDEEMFRVSFCIECSNAVDRKQYALVKEERAERYKKKRNVNDYFVYKFVSDNNQIIYIGKTIRLEARMVEHFKTESHLPDECYDNVKYVFYCSFKTNAEMDIYEM